MDNKRSEEAGLFAMQLTSGSVVQMVLKTAIELDLLELIKKAGPEAAASAAELAAQLPTNNPDAVDMLDRILRLLAAYSVLVCSLKQLPDGGLERRYSLSPVGEFLTRNEDGVSVGTFCLMIQDKVSMEPWYHLKDAILEGGIPFDRAYGMSVRKNAGIEVADNICLCLTQTKMKKQRTKPKYARESLIIDFDLNMLQMFLLMICMNSLSFQFWCSFCFYYCHKETKESQVVAMQ